MKKAKYNFEWISSQSLIDWMDSAGVTTLHVEEIAGVRFAVSSCGHRILMAGTVAGLNKNMQICTVTNKRHRSFPDTFNLITWQPFCYQKGAVSNKFTRSASQKRRGRNRYELAA